MIDFILTDSLTLALLSTFNTISVSAVRSIKFLKGLKDIPGSLEGHP